MNVILIRNLNNMQILEKTLPSVAEEGDKENLEGLDLKSDFGIKCYKDSEHKGLSLWVPVPIFEKIHQGEKLKQMIEENFSLGAKVEDSFYVIAFPKDTALEKLQEIADEIENRHKNID